MTVYEASFEYFGDLEVNSVHESLLGAKEACRKLAHPRSDKDLSWRYDEKAREYSANHPTHGGTFCVREVDVLP